MMRVSLTPQSSPKAAWLSFNMRYSYQNMARLSTMTHRLHLSESCSHSLCTPNLRYSTILFSCHPYYCVARGETLPNIVTMTPANSQSHPSILHAVRLLTNSPKLTALPSHSGDVCNQSQTGTGTRTRRCAQYHAQVNVDYKGSEDGSTIR